MTQATNHETLFCPQALIWLWGPTQCRITISQALGNAHAVQLIVLFCQKTHMVAFSLVQRVRLRIAPSLPIHTVAFWTFTFHKKRGCV